MNQPPFSFPDALVTGAGGFIGRHLVDHLINGGVRVTVLERPSAQAWCTHRWDRHVDFAAHDGTAKAMVETLQNKRPSIVFHLASCFLAAHNLEDIENLIHSNLLFGTQLLEAMHQTGSRRLINAGTSWQHFGSATYRPVNLYAATKQAFESIIDYYVDAHDFDVVTLKLFDTYGPGDPRKKLVALLAETQATQTPVAMSPGNQRVDLLYIDDVVAAFIASASLLMQEPKTAHRRFGAPSGERLSLKGLVKVFEEVTGKRCPVEWGGRPYRLREVMEPWDGLPVLPGWQSKVSLREGLRHTLGLSDASLSG